MGNNFTKSPFEIRDKPIYHCSECDEGIFAIDVPSGLLSCDGQPGKIRCPRCGHVDVPGEKRDYGVKRPRR